MTDWDDGGSSGFGAKPSTGFGGGFGRGRGKVEGGFSTGMGRGRGRGSSGFGKPNNFTDSWNDSGSSGGGFGSTNGTSNGFGGGTSGGFGSKPSGGGGFGSSNGGGGFGSSNGGGGFGRSEDSDGPRGGGFGGSSGGGGFGGSSGGGGFGGSSGGGGFGGGDRKERGGGCYKCGEDGHMARECPSADAGGGSRGPRTCRKCNEEGHIARDCPTGGGGGGGGGSCYKCGEAGHFARECPSAESGGGSRGGFGGGGGGSFGGGGSSSGGGSGCHKCGEEGHFARECPTGGGGGANDGKCFKCQEEGHMSRDCPNRTEEEKKREPNYIPPTPTEEEEAAFNSMQRGINFDKYDEIPVECSGEGRPTSGISTFDEGDLSQTFRDNVRKAGYERPTPVQKWAIPIIRQGRDLMACAQTGSGKTAAFLLPVLTGMVEAGAGGGGMMASQAPMAIIIGPTRELVVQIYNEAAKFARGSMIRPVVVYGGVSVQHQLSQVSRGANMVIGTPGRLSDFITRGAISLTNVKYLILDEADRMLDMGFGPEVRKIVEENGMPGKDARQTLLFSATFPEDIQRLARDFLNNYLFVTVGRVGSANTDIKQSVYEVSQFDKREKLVEILNESGKDRVLVFVETKRQADFIASYLSQSSFPTTSIHGDRLQREREEALHDFKSGKAPVLVATSVAARGLDIPGVAHVVNYDLPKDIDEYVHRIGRTGRCGNLGKASSFFDPNSNADMARALVKTLEDAQQEVPAFLESAAEMGTGTGFGGGGGKFGGRDARRGNFNDDNGGGGGFDSAPVEDESWD